MAGLDPTSPERVAALVAPVLDRLRSAIAGHMTAGLREVAEEFGLDAGGALTMAMLRNTRPDRAVTRSDVQAVLRYTAPGEVDAGIASAVAAGVLETLPDSGLRVSGRGQDLLARVYAVGCDVVTGLWAGHDERVAALGPLTMRAIDAAVPTGGPAFAVMSPPHEPAGAPPAMVLAERLTPLRFHRFDAHVAAWRAAGLTVEEVGRSARDRCATPSSRRPTGAPPRPMWPSTPTSGWRSSPASGRFRTSQAPPWSWSWPGGARRLPVAAPARWSQGGRGVLAGPGRPPRSAGGGRR